MFIECDLDALTEEQRVDFFNGLREEYCLDCGRRFTKERPFPCHCENDD